MKKKLILALAIALTTAFKADAQLNFNYSAQNPQQQTYCEGSTARLMYAIDLVGVGQVLTIHLHKAGTTASTSLSNVSLTRDGNPVTFTSSGAFDQNGNLNVSTLEVINGSATFAVYVDINSPSNQTSFSLSISKVDYYDQMISFKTAISYYIPSLMNVATCTNMPVANFSLDKYLICPQEQLTLADSSFGSNTTIWEWEFNGGNPNTWTGQNPPPVTYYNAGSFKVWLTLTDTATGLVSKFTQILNVNPQPQLGFTPLYIPIKCSGDTVNLTASGGTSYQWIVNGNLISDTTANYVVDSTSVIQVSCTSLGCTSWSNFLNVNYEDVPQVLTQFQTYGPNANGGTLNVGNQTIEMCDQASAQLGIYIPNTWVPNATTLWNTGSPVGYTNTDTSGIYWCTISSGNGCVYHSDTTNVIIHPLPVPVITTTPDRQFYCFDQFVSLTTDTANNYRWFSGGSQLAFNTQSITVGQPAANYQVEVNDGVCWGVSQTVNLNFFPQLYKPVITSSGNGCQAAATSGPYSYTWKKNGVVVLGVTGQLLSILDSGFYTVTVTDANSCSNTSDPVWLSCTSGILELGNNKEISIYPNPMYDDLSIRIKGDLNAKLYSTEGKLVANKSGRDQINIERGDIPAGMYTLQVINGKKVYNKKVILQ